MEKVIIDGGTKLEGTITVSGMKNAAVAVLYATVLAGDVCIIENLPNISDVRISLDIFRKASNVYLVKRRGDLIVFFLYLSLFVRKRREKSVSAHIATVPNLHIFGSAEIFRPIHQSKRLQILLRL